MDHWWRKKCVVKQKAIDDNNTNQGAKVKGDDDGVQGILGQVTSASSSTSIQTSSSEPRLNTADKEASVNRGRFPKSFHKKQKVIDQSEVDGVNHLILNIHALRQ